MTSMAEQLMPGDRWTNLFEKLPKGSDVSAIAFSPDGKLLASVLRDGVVSLWNLTAERAIRKLESHQVGPAVISFSPNSRLLALSTTEISDSTAEVSDSTTEVSLSIWNVTTGELLQKLEGLGEPSKATFSTDGRLLALVSDKESVVMLWSPTTGELAQILESHTAVVADISFSPDGRLLASASDDSTVRVWNLRTGKLSQKLKHHKGAVNAVLFSPDGQLLASAAEDLTVILWNPTTGELLRKLKGHSDSIKAIAFSPDGRLASASLDQTVRLWNPTTGELLQQLDCYPLVQQPLPTLVKNSNSIRAIFFSPEGHILVSLSYDKVEFWTPGAARAKTINPTPMNAHYQLPYSKKEGQ